MKNSAINLSLMGLVTLLAVVVWLTPATDHPRAPTPLTPFTPAQITHIQRIDRHGQPLRLVRQGDGWRLTEPYTLAADAEKIDRLLQIVSAPVLKQFPVPADRLPEFGLEAPLARLVLNDLQLLFGGTDPINHHRYVRLGGNLCLIKDIFAHHLLGPAEAFISPRLVPEEARIQGLRTPDWQLSRGAGGDWRLTPPTPGLPGDRLVAKIDAWQRGQALRVEAVRAEEAARFVEIRLTGDPDPLRFAILDRPGGTLLVRQALGLGYRLPVGSDLLAVPGADEP